MGYVEADLDFLCGQNHDPNLRAFALRCYECGSGETRQLTEDVRALLKLVDEAMEVFANVNIDSTYDHFDEQVQPIRKRVLAGLAKELHSLGRSCEQI